MRFNHLLSNGKNSKINYYARSYVSRMLPRVIFREALSRELSRLSKLSTRERDYVEGRVDYYCKLPEGQISPLSVDAPTLLDHHARQDRGYASCYYFDSYEFTRYFDESLRWEYIFGDVIHVPERASIVKSRPLVEDNQNSVLLKLNKVRHFISVKDHLRFEDKLNMAIFRGDTIEKPNRSRFLEQFMEHPMCDLGDTNPRSGSPQEWLREPISIYDHLKYKFIFALEGNDVASNLKWVMSSSSLAVMPAPTCETWYMEGLLRGGEHYVEVKSDFSDLDSKLQYYIDHPKESNEISVAANRYAAEFRNEERERLISLMVLERYFKRTGQL